MPQQRNLRILVVGLCLCAALAGCKKNDRPMSLKLKKSSRKPKITIPLHIKGTVAQYARFAGGGNLPIQAHGIVIGLGDKGSSEVPDRVRKSLTEYLLKQKLGSYRMGTRAVTPDLVLKDKDTSVVLVGGSLAPGAPVGTRFDVFVTALPQTQTQSLDGGILMPIDLSVAFGPIRRPRQKQATVLARAGGPVFVNPFLDPTAADDLAKLRTGRVIGGGKVVRARAVRIMLRRSDYATADQIQRRINERFPSDERIANALNRSVVELTIPDEYRDDYEHFLELVMHLPIRYASGEWEARARQIAARMEMPEANHDELALVWEAMGRQVVPIVRNLYASKNSAAAYHAARTGARLGDRQAGDVLIRFATSANSPYQIPAIEELARHGRIRTASPTLRQLLDDPNGRVRIAAYEALLRRGDRSAVTRIDVSGQFTLDLVATRRSYTIYATQTKEPKIALFGRDMEVNRPIYFESPDGLVTINAFGDGKKLKVFRTIPRGNRISDPFDVDCAVGALVRVLGTRPDLDKEGKPKGLGLTYSQIVGVLYRLCRDEDIPAKFVLQQMPGLERIYRRAATVGRPDMPSR